jgi:hypothetical protein
MYCFTKKLCPKIAGSGVAMQSQIITRNQNEVASKLTVGDFLLFRKNDDDVEPIWLGRIMSNPDWQGQGVHQNEPRQRSSFHGVKFGQGEVGLYLMWYEKIDVMSERLEYWVSRAKKTPIVQNNRELVPIEVTMHQMLKETNVVPRLRTSARGNTEISVNNNVRRIEDWHAKYLHIV